MNKNIIIGTAGHIDHGKTTLIKALTGTDTDRLKEEKKRGISIDLGFTSFKINENKSAGIIDVPGHEKFLKNMLAGVAGMDMILLVVSAEEGIMPQTREHLDILNLIGIKKGIVVITKAEKVEKEFIELIKEDIISEIKGTFLENSEIIAVDSISRFGINDLVKKIDNMTDEVEPKNLSVPARMFVDRVFSIKGFGTVLTGTLIEGTLNVDDEVTIYPKKITSKVRNIQVHSKSVNSGYAGQRVAVNVSGISVDEVERGDILSSSNSIPKSMMIDAKIKILKNASRDLEHWDRVRVYHGAREILGRVVPLEKNRINKGEEGYVQIRLEEVLASKSMDKIILRFYSPMETIGGGTILDPNPPKHNINLDIVENLRIKEEGRLEDKIEKVLMESSSPLLSEVITQELNEDKKIVEEGLEILIEEERALKINEGYFSKDKLAELNIKAIDVISKYHKTFPYRFGISKEELRSRVYKSFKPKDFDKVLELLNISKEVKIKENIISLTDFEITYEGKGAAVKKELENHYLNNMSPLQTDKVTEKDSLKEEILNSLIGIKLQRISDDLIYDISLMEKIKNDLLNFLAENEKITVKDFKDMTGLSRKYTIAILEYFDNNKITKRDGDFRIKYN
ncbi:selenocysteine-specific elongation factor [Acetoanaerobium pronyense]|uniref:Selenocysteine-specific elongation factor n=1 Tax=Acetoanaerobium pronyense TaxID=1482736 RepID=A0ABS4KGS7_9FIRM|nr:selenocysteine-specific translation elongation factor [Acetoanaerobium pronyense]MBP2026979.1 selenocysteine-specific elongation factor [Acetoanaerobium pronyense]